MTRGACGCCEGGGGVLGGGAGEPDVVMRRGEGEYVLFGVVLLLLLREGEVCRCVRRETRLGVGVARTGVSRARPRGAPVRGSGDIVDEGGGGVAGGCRFRSSERMRDGIDEPGALGVEPKGGSLERDRRGVGVGEGGSIAARISSR